MLIRRRLPGDVPDAIEPRQPECRPTQMYPSGVWAIERMEPLTKPSRIFQAVCAYWLTSSAGFNAKVQLHAASRMTTHRPCMYPPLMAIPSLSLTSFAAPVEAALTIACSYRIEIQKPVFKKLIKPDVVLHVQDALEVNGQRRSSR
jgi:hypothetical protein